MKRVLMGVALSLLLTTACQRKEDGAFPADPDTPVTTDTVSTDTVSTDTSATGSTDTSATTSTTGTSRHDQNPDNTTTRTKPKLSPKDST